MKSILQDEKGGEELSKKRNIIGNRYGHLTVIAEAGKTKDNHFLSLVRCDCGEEHAVRDTELIYGRIQGCRKCSNKTHGMSKDRMFFIWQSMRARCNNPNNLNYKHYGGRGIKVCDEWNKSFESFRDWALANGYTEDLSIDRIDVNGNYEPSNCRWVTQLEQARNRRDNVMIDYNGELTPITVVAELTGIKSQTIYARIQSGWTHFDATHTKIMDARDTLPKQRCMRRRKVKMISEDTGEEKTFDSLTDASRFMGYEKGYLNILSGRLKSRDFYKNVEFCVPL